MARNWRHVGSPLRPEPQDLAWFEGALQRWLQAHPGRCPRGLILGVTPELFDLPWPDRTRLRALDRTQAMIDHIWPGPPRAAMLQDWRSITLPEADVDLVMCDGGLHLLDHPQGQAALCSHLARIVAPGGLVVFRLFIPPRIREDAASVLQALNAGGIRDLNCLKLRLGMALQQGPEQGVALADVWSTLRAEVNEDWSELSARLGWRLEQLQIIDAYRDSGARYHFVSTEQAVGLFRVAGFDHIATHESSYEMGTQCPVVVFRRC